VQTEQRQPPQPIRAEGVLRLQLEHEFLQVVEPVDRRHRPRERAGRRAEDPADPRPDRARAQPLEEAELHQHAVDAAAREDDRDIASHPAIVRAKAGAA
jgi:hypothetical protein